MDNRKYTSSKGIVDREKREEKNENIGEAKFKDSQTDGYTH